MIPGSYYDVADRTPFVPAQTGGASGLLSPWAAAVGPHPAARPPGSPPDGFGRRPTIRFGDVRLLLTNDDGIDSVGLHVLARAMRPHGDVVIIAPDSEYSGASCAVGALHLAHPEARRRHVEGIDEAWSLSGPPALCVMFARLGAFGGPFDLVVSGINPGANVGRSVYHSGTVGAALSGRIGNISGIAVSQSVTVGASRARRGTR